MAPAFKDRHVRSLRRRVRNSIALVASVSLLLFGIPLGVVLDRLIHSQALAGLQRDATKALASVPDNTLHPGGPTTLPRRSGSTHLGVYDVGGNLVAGIGPTRSVLAAAVADGREHDGREQGELSVVVPVLSDATVAGGIRAAVSLSGLRSRVYRAWSLLAALALAVVGVAVMLARQAAARISAPFEHITIAARALGMAEYEEVHLPRWGILEADAAGEALQESAQRIDALVAHERQFMTDASHQLRTPLAGALLCLESEPPNVRGALDNLQHLHTTISDLVAVRGTGGTALCDPFGIAAEAVARWSSSERPVTLRCDGTGLVRMDGAALRQSLDVLLDNALRHGRAPVTVTVEPYGDALVVEVADSGLGFADTAQPGTGLQLVSRVVERAGGSLLIRRRAPQARVALLLPMERT